MGVDVFNRVVRVAQHGCESYNAGEYTLAGNYRRSRATIASSKRLIWIPIVSLIRNISGVLAVMTHANR